MESRDSVVLFGSNLDDDGRLLDSAGKRVFSAKPVHNGIVLHDCIHRVSLKPVGLNEGPG